MNRIIPTRPLRHVEKNILANVDRIESWFCEQWSATSAPVTSSVDLRHSGFKIAPVDTNLFPAGFNNLNPDFFPLCIQAVQSVLSRFLSQCKGVLLLPESHTRNRFYLQSLAVLRTILMRAGFKVRLGSLDPDLKKPLEIQPDSGECFYIEPLVRVQDRIGVGDFDPCLILLNNDLSTGIPEILRGIEQPIHPTEQLGWSNRLKSTHFHYFDTIAAEFAQLINLDPWLINPYFSSVSSIDFITQEGLDVLAEQVAQLLTKIQKQYTLYNVDEQPFVAVKADNGTYGMSVMMVNDACEILQLNRKQRTRMASSKGSRKVDKVIIQEGIYSCETTPNGFIAEPVVYMIGPFVVGGFYRVHHERGSNENLNAPGMHFEPLAFTEACNMPSAELDPLQCSNRFYVYGVIARLGALAAAQEITALER